MSFTAAGNLPERLASISPSVRHAPTGILRSAPALRALQHVWDAGLVRERAV